MDDGVVANTKYFRYIKKLSDEVSFLCYSIIFFKEVNGF